MSNTSGGSVWAPGTYKKCHQGAQEASKLAVFVEHRCRFLTIGGAIWFRPFYGLLAFLWPFWIAFWIRMCRDLIKVLSMLFYQIVGTRPAYGHKITMYGFFRPIWGPSGSPRGPKRGPRHRKGWTHQLTNITDTIAIIYKV